MAKIESRTPESIREEVIKTYTITPDGRCINRERGTDVVFHVDEKGYRKARLWCPALSKNEDGRVNFRMHRLVAIFHLKEFNPDLQVNHKNGIKTDNRVENLEMVTCSENVDHAWNVLDSAERRKGASKRRTGQKHSEESKKKISISHIGIASVPKHTEESIKKMSQSRRAWWEKKKLTEQKAKKL